MGGSADIVSGRPTYPKGTLAMSLTGRSGWLKSVLMLTFFSHSQFLDNARFDFDAWT